MCQFFLPVMDGSLLLFAVIDVKHLCVLCIGLAYGLKVFERSNGNK